MSTSLSPVMSKYQTVKAFGILAFLSFAAVYIIYATWFISVWCFFAALLSAVVYIHFILRRAGRSESRPLRATIVFPRSAENSFSDHHS